MSTNISNTLIDSFVASVAFRPRQFKVTLSNAASLLAQSGNLMELVEEKKHLRTKPHVFDGYEKIILRYKVDGSSEAGQNEIQQVLQKGKYFPIENCPALHSQEIDGKSLGLYRWYVSYAIANDTKATFYLTPGRCYDLFDQLGFVENANPRKSRLEQLLGRNKRSRRLFAPAQLTLKGQIISETEGFWNVEFVQAPTGMTEHILPVKIYTIQLDRAYSYNGKLAVDGPAQLRVGILQLGQDEVSQKVLSYTDGGHLLNPRSLQNLMAQMGLTDPAFTHAHTGEGAQFTFVSPAGQAKGNIAFAPLADLDILCCDIKTEVARKDNEVTLSISSIHKPGLVRGDIQSFINGNFEAIDLYYVAARRWINSVAQAFRSDELMRELLGLVETEETIPESDWVIRSFFRLTQKHLIDSKGSRLSVLHFPGLAKKIYRHLTQCFMDRQQFRIPLPTEWATAGYAMFDITVLQHPHEEKNGRGFYFSNGVLPAQSISLHRRADLGHGVSLNLPIEGSVVMHRQPTGTGREWVRRVEAVRHPFYEQLHNSPFNFLSVQPIEMTPELVSYYSPLLGQNGKGENKLDLLMKVWGNQIPTNVLYMAIMGGGDYDDRTIVYHHEKIVTHLHSLEAKLQEYPVQPLPASEDHGVYADLHMEPGATDEFDWMVSQRLQENETQKDPVAEMIKTVTRSAMIGRLSKAAFFYNYLQYNGLPTGTSNIATMCAMLETVVDFEKMGKGGNVVALADQELKNFYRTVPAVPDFLVGQGGHTANRLPTNAERDRENPIEVLPTRTGEQWAKLSEILDTMDQRFQLAFQSRKPQLEKRIEYLRAFELSKDALNQAKQLRREYLATYKVEKAKALEACQGSQYNSFREELELEASMQAVKLADARAIEILDVQPGAAYTPEQLQAVIALYNQIMSERKLNRQTGEFYPVSDAQLFAPRLSHLFAMAIQYAHAAFYQEKAISTAA